MPIDTTIFASDVLAVENDLPQTFIWRGKTYACMAGDKTDGQKLIEEGFSGDSTVTILVRISLFAGELPKANDVITYDGAEYRISAGGVSKAVDGLTILIPLVSKTD